MIRFTRLALLIATLFPVTAAHAEEPLWGESASTLGKGFLNAATFGDLRQSRPYFHHGGLVALTINRTDVGVRLEYGLRPDLDLRVRIPYFKETIKETVQGQSLEQPLSGLGEITIGAKWRFRQSITDRRKDELSLHVDIKLPTGNSRMRDVSGEPITPHLQPNTGNLGATLGLAADRHTRLGGYWLSGMVSAETRSHWLGRGVAYDLHASLGRRLRPFTCADRSDWMGILGLHFHRMSKDRELGATIRDSGGTVLGGELGVTLSIGNRLVRLGILLPLTANVGKAHAPPRREIQASIRAGF